MFYYVQLVRGEDDRASIQILISQHTLSFLFCSLGCPSGWSEHDGNCYKFFPQQLTWDSARSVCSGIGGDLALPTSQTNQYISTFARKNRSQQTWIGVFR